MDDLVTYAFLTASGAFIIIAIVMLARYRQVSRRINASSDLGRELWQALETRLKKQDERILDMMARVEVIQSRAVKERAAEALETPGVLGLPPQMAPQPAEEPRETQKSPEPAKPEESHEVTSQPPTPQPAPSAGASDELLKAIEAKLDRQESQMMEMQGRLGAVQDFAIQRATQPIVPQAVSPSRRPVHAGEIKERDLLQMLSDKPRTSVEIRERFDITREHAARLLKALFDRGLVVRNDSAKPYVYELTDQGRQTLASS